MRIFLAGASGVMVVEFGFLVDLDPLRPNAEVVRHVVSVSSDHKPGQPHLARPIRLGIKGERCDDRARCPSPVGRQLQPLNGHERHRSTPSRECEVERQGGARRGAARGVDRVECEAILIAGGSLDAHGLE